MNLYFRWFWMIARLWLRPGSVSLTEPFRRLFCVLPSDCDLNFHLTNSRYFALIDLARIEQLARLKLLRPLIARRWQPVLSATEITFIRPLPPLRRFELVTRILTWDDKYFYFEQRFETPGKVYAVSLGRAAFVCRGERVPPARVAALSGYLEAPADPVLLETWRRLLKQKKDYFS